MRDKRVSMSLSEPSWRPVLLEALATVNRPTLCGLEGDFCFLSTVRADDLGHLSWATVIASAPVSITQYFHSFYVCMKRMPRGRSLMLRKSRTPPLLNICFFTTS